MLRKAPILFLAAALMLAVLAAVSAHRWMLNRASQSAAVKVVSAPIVVAKADLPAGQRLEAQDLAVQQWPQGHLPPGSLSQPEQAQGRVLKGPAVAGEVILASKLAPEGTLGGLSAVVPEGYRAITVHVDEVVGVAGFLQPGDRVDVFMTVDKGPFQNDPATRLVLQDVPVLAVGEKVQEEDGGGNKVHRHKATVVTLQLKPDEGERLVLGSSEGRVLLALRSQGDHQDHQSGGVRMASLMPGLLAAARPAAPAKPPQPTIEVIKGVTRSLQTLGKPQEKAQAGPPAKTKED